MSNTNDVTLKAILKYRNHPSIIAIQNRCKDKSNFNFIEVDQKQIEQENAMRCDIRNDLFQLSYTLKIFQNFNIFKRLHITQSNIYDGAVIVKIVSR